MEPELKVLNMKQRRFIDLIVYEGVDRTEAYAEAYGKELNEDTKQKISASASRLFNLPHVVNYFNALNEEMREAETSKVLWTKEVATEKLLRLIERAEEDLYGYDEDGNRKNITMSRLNAIVLPAKELNLMHGLNQTNLNVEGQLVQIIGEAELID